MASENGWEPSHAPADLLEWRVVPGTNPPVRLQVMKGWPATIMIAYAADYNAYVEKLRDADSASFTPTNSVATSNHLNGTAMDLNWNDHPFHVSYGGYSPEKIATMRELLAFYEKTMFWSQDWDSPKDCMHHQMGYNTWNQPWVLDFINRKIRADGFSTFRRGGTVTPAPPASNSADVLARATGLTLARATEILPTVQQGLQLSQCTNPNRIAMWLAQMGHESASFVYTEEIAKNGRYAPYIGRTWIQITWDYNYRAFSQWCFEHGLVPAPDYFVANYTELADLKWAGIGPAWYWTVSRPQINALSDARNLTAVTQAINGGQNGAADRKSRYDRASALGDQLLALLTTAPSTPGDDMASVPQDQWDRVYRELTQKLPSRSPLRHLGEGMVDTMAGFVLNTDGSEHVEVCRLLAGYGHPPTLALLREVAGADPTLYPDRQDDAQLAQAILAEATTTVVAPSKAPQVAAVAPAPQIVYVDRPATPAPTVTWTDNATTPGQLIGRAYDALAALPPNLDPIEKASLTAVMGVIQAKTEGASA